MFKYIFPSSAALKQRPLCSASLIMTINLAVSLFVPLKNPTRASSVYLLYTVKGISKATQLKPQPQVKKTIRGEMNNCLCAQQAPRFDWRFTDINPAALNHPSRTGSCKHVSRSNQIIQLKLCFQRFSQTFWTVAELKVLHHLGRDEQFSLNPSTAKKTQLREMFSPVVSHNREHGKLCSSRSILDL